MKFCAKCGAKLECDQQTCPQCGYKLSSRQNKVVTEKAVSAQPVNNNKIKNDNIFIADSNEVRKKLVLSKGAKISIVGIIISVVLFITFFIVGNSLSKPSKVVSKFEKAVASDNKSEITSILYCNDNRVEINEKNISGLLSYFKDNPSYLNTVIQDLNKEAFKAEETKGLSVMNDSKSQSVLSLTYAGKKFLFFPSYKIGIKPTFIQVKTGIKDVTLSLNSTEIGKSDTDNYSKEFGPFIPGKYKLSANYKGKYVTLSEPHDVDLIAASNGKLSVDVLTNLNYIKIRSEYPEAEIFVNGKDTGIKAKDAENFGPLNADTKVYATISKDGKTLKSNEYTISKGDTDVYLNFTEAENRMKNVQGQIHDLIYWYTYHFTQAVNTNNFSSVEYYIYPGSKLYDEQKSYVPSTYSKGIKETIMSFNITSCTLNEDNISGTVTTEEVYSIEDNGKSSIKNFKYKYTFRYNEAKASYQLESIADNN